MKTVGAYFQVYKNKKATDFVLSKFRKYYPDSPVMLISDGGDDFEDISKKYNTGYKKSHHIFVVDNDSYYNSERTIEAWSRHKLAVDYANTDYIMILEDDVLIQDRVNFDNFDIRGPIANNIPPGGIREIERNGGIVGLGKYGACGGSVYKSESFRKVYDSAIDYTKKYHDKNFFSLPKIAGYDDRNICALDCNIVFHFSRMGFKYENADWLGEVFRHSNWREFPIVHQYKEHY